MDLVVPQMDADQAQLVVSMIPSGGSGLSRAEFMAWVDTQKAFKAFRMEQRAVVAGARAEVEKKRLLLSAGTPKFVNKYMPPAVVDEDKGKVKGKPVDDKKLQGGAFGGGAFGGGGGGGGGKKGWGALKSAANIKSAPLVSLSSLVLDEGSMKRIRFQKLVAAVRKKHPAALSRLNELTVWDPPAKPNSICLLVLVWAICLGYSIFLVYYLMLFSLEQSANQSMAWMKMSGFALGQSLVIGEPIKFCVIAWIMSCLPVKTKKQCISCLQTCSVCASVMGMIIGMTVVAIAENIDIQGAIEEIGDGLELDMEIEFDAEADADVEVDADADADMDAGGAGDDDMAADADFDDADMDSEAQLN
jgi:hypothetical protein